jgi:small conductance mechanosensitive channel
MNWGEMWHNIGAWLASEGLNTLWIIVIGGAVYYLTHPVVSWLMRHISRGIPKKTPRGEVKKRQKTLTGLFVTIIHILIVIVVIFTILAKTGMNLAPILASAGVVGIALGFGAQSLVRDSLAGLFIILENQYRVGDYVEITGSGITNAGGTVEKISLRSTILRDRDGNVHFVPNGAVTQAINKTLGYSKVHFTIPVGQDTDVEKLTDIINGLGRQMAKDKAWQDKIIDPPHFVEVGNITKNGFEVTISGITQPADQWLVGSEFKTRLMAELKKAKIAVV